LAAPVTYNASGLLELLEPTPNSGGELLASDATTLADNSAIGSPSSTAASRFRPSVSELANLFGIADPTFGPIVPNPALTLQSLPSTNTTRNNTAQNLATRLTPDLEPLSASELLTANAPAFEAANVLPINFDAGDQDTPISAAGTLAPPAATFAPVASAGTPAPATGTTATIGTTGTATGTAIGTPGVTADTAATVVIGTTGTTATSVPPSTTVRRVNVQQDVSGNFRFATVATTSVPANTIGSAPPAGPAAGTVVGPAVASSLLIDYAARAYATITRNPTYAEAAAAIYANVAIFRAQRDAPMPRPADVVQPVAGPAKIWRQPDSDDLRRFLAGLEREAGGSGR